MALPNMANESLSFGIYSNLEKFHSLIFYINSKSILNLVFQAFFINKKYQ